MSFVFSRLINLSGAVVGVLALANGGTNKALTAVNGGLVWSDADSMEITAAGTAQNWVLSGGAGTPTMSNTTTTGKTVDGSADEVQFTVQGHSTQTNNILLVERSDGTDLVTVSGGTAGTAHLGRTDGAAPAAGFVGQVITAAGNAASTTVLSTRIDASATLTLTAGSWIIIGAGCGYFNTLAGTGTAGIQAAIVNTSDATDVAVNEQIASASVVPTIGDARVYPFSLMGVVNLSATKNFKLQIRTTTISGTPTGSGAGSYGNSTGLLALRVN